jgi:threonine dehydratase
MIDCPVSIDEIRAAALTLNGVAIRTPLLENPDVKALLIGRLLLLAEAAPETQVSSAEPALFDETRWSLEAGHRVTKDAGVRKAMRFTYDHFRIVAEPGAVVGAAAILNGQVPITGGTEATVITGGNIDIARFAALLEDEE